MSQLIRDGAAVDRNKNRVTTLGGAPWDAEASQRETNERFKRSIRAQSPDGMTARERAGLPDDATPESVAAMVFGSDPTAQKSGAELQRDISERLGLTPDGQPLTDQLRGEQRLAAARLAMAQQVVASNAATKQYSAAVPVSLAATEADRVVAEHLGIRAADRTAYNERHGILPPSARLSAQARQPAPATRAHLAARMAVKARMEVARLNASVSDGSNPWFVDDAGSVRRRIA